MSIKLFVVVIAALVVVAAARQSVTIRNFEDPFCGNLPQNTSLYTGVCYRTSVVNASAPRLSLSCRKAARRCFSAEVFTDTACQLPNLKSVDALRCDSCSISGATNWRCISDSTIDLRIGCTNCDNCTLHALVPVGQCTNLGTNFSVRVRKIAPCSIVTQDTYTDAATAPTCSGSHLTISAPTGLCFSAARGGSQMLSCDGSSAAERGQKHAGITVLEPREAIGEH